MSEKKEYGFNILSIVKERSSEEFKIYKKTATKHESYEKFEKAVIKRALVFNVYLEFV